MLCRRERWNRSDHPSLPRLFFPPPFFPLFFSLFCALFLSILPHIPRLSFVRSGLSQGRLLVRGLPPAARAHETRYICRRCGIHQTVIQENNDKRQKNYLCAIIIFQIVPPKTANKPLYCKYNGRRPYRKGCKRSYKGSLPSQERERGRGKEMGVSADRNGPPHPPQEQKWARHQGDTLTLVLFLSPRRPLRPYTAKHT